MAHKMLAPTSILKKLDGGYTLDRLTNFLQMVKQRCQFDHWFLGHYQRNCNGGTSGMTAGYR